MALVGLKNFHYATVENDSASSTTYGTMKKLGNAVSVDINPTINKTNLYGDDMAVATDISFGEITVSIETTDVPLEDQAILLGHTYDSTTSALTAKSSDVAPYVGLAFESQKHDGGIRCVKLCKGKFAPSQENISTKGDQLNYQTPKLEGTFVARQSDGAWKIIKDVAASVTGGTSSWYTTF